MPNDNGDESLLDEVKHTSEARLSRGIKAVDGLTEDQEKGLGRTEKYLSRVTRRHIASFLLWASAIIATIVGLVLAAAFSFLIWTYVQTLISGDKVASVVNAMVAYVFGVVSAVAAEYFLRRGRREDR